MISAPNFITSSYFVPELNNWHLKPGAPEEVKREFDEWCKHQDEANENGVFL